MIDVLPVPKPYETFLQVKRCGDHSVSLRFYPAITQYYPTTRMEEMLGLCVGSPTLRRLEMYNIPIDYLTIVYECLARLKNKVWEEIVLFKQHIVHDHMEWIGTRILTSKLSLVSPLFHLSYLSVLAHHENLELEVWLDPNVPSTLTDVQVRALPKRIRMHGHHESFAKQATECGIEIIQAYEKPTLCHDDIAYPV